MRGYYAGPGGGWAEWSSGCLGMCRVGEAEQGMERAVGSFTYQVSPGVWGGTADV